MFTPRPAALAATSALLGVLLIAACASRQPPRGGPQGGPPSGGNRTSASLDGGQIARPIALLFTGMDTSHDRATDPAELAHGIAAEWASLPADPRGTVPALEISAWAATALGNPEALPNQISFDVNLDGRISQEEFAARLKAEFARLDRDHDGRLTRAEMLSDVPMRQRAQDGGSRPSGGPPGGGGGRPPR